MRFPPMAQQQQQQQPQLGQIFNNFNLDPHVVETQVIPNIINQAKEQLRNGIMNNDDFSAVMKQVMVLKEQSMMKQAENKENQMRHNPWAMVGGGSGPGMMEPMPQQQQQHFPGPVPPQQQQQQQQQNKYMDLPLASPEDMDLVKNDPFKSIQIDNQEREIRYYGEIVTCVMNDDSIHELTFQPGDNNLRRVVLDDNPAIIPDPLPIDTGEYVDFALNGAQHKIRIGAPTREIWIDGNWYECFFDKGIEANISGTFHNLFLEGPPPNVNIGRLRSDLCEGFVHLIPNGDLNAQMKLFLDSKPQLVHIGGKPHILKFVDGFRMILINGHPFKADFGGIPMIVHVNGNRHFLRYS